MQLIPITILIENNQLDFLLFRGFESLSGEGLKEVFILSEARIPVYYFRYYWPQLWFGCGHQWVTKKEIESEVGAALAAPASADSAAKAKSKFAESRRKKNEEKRKNLGETKP